MKKDPANSTGSLDWRGLQRVAGARFELATFGL